MHLDPETVRKLIADVAAREITPRFRALSHGEVRQKKPGDLVTIADEAAEERLEAALTALVPDSVCVGEEAAARDRGVLDVLQEHRPVWVIDPVDGTGNFAHGRTPFAVMVALVEGGETLAAWIHDPIAGWTASAERGGGAWLNGERLQVATPPADPLALRGTLHVGSHGNRGIQRQVNHGRNHLGVVKSQRCAGAEYVMLARGEQDYGLFTKLEPWDHAPGALILTEAGGVARLLDGLPYSPGAPRTNGLLLAANEATWSRVYATLFGDAPATNEA
ncbi:fructose-1,6-bisphosphatase [Limimonas halophila]|uniref:Fructose-1,6-bisphosphatase n=1 Tax=Limimonas halophila TaxID=1082479 RepID=A0A1G7NDI6_9PROT|nr:inositol monophosphatase family protein [Limimonas halophila]SDF71981.1 fructose-1,6-bisphosphatase [Limimonas halophila]